MEAMVGTAGVVFRESRRNIRMAPIGRHPRDPTPVACPGDLDTNRCPATLFQNLDVRPGTSAVPRGASGRHSPVAECANYRLFELKAGVRPYSGMDHSQRISDSRPNARRRKAGLKETGGGSYFDWFRRWKFRPTSGFACVEPCSPLGPAGAVAVAGHLGQHAQIPFGSATGPDGTESSVSAKVAGVWFAVEDPSDTGPWTPFTLQRERLGRCRPSQTIPEGCPRSARRQLSASG